MGVLLNYLDQRQAAGQTHAWLSDSARAVLREAMVAARRPGGAPAQRPAAGTARALPKPAAETGPPAAIARARYVPPSEGPVAKPAADDAVAKPEAGDLWRQLDEVKAGVLACEKYAALIEKGALRKTMVFAVGDPTSPLMFIGEAPGDDEERQGEPFVGKAGQLLTKIIQAMGLDRSKVYISNIVKYRPSTGSEAQGSTNRAPTLEEMAAGLPHLRREIEIVKPRVIVTLGATSTQALLGDKAGTISRARGRFHDFGGIPVMPTFHPSYLLRNPALTERRKLWEDLLQVMEKLAMSISEKQRKFFLPA